MTWRMLKKSLRSGLEKGVSADMLRQMEACNYAVEQFEKVFGTKVVKWTKDNYWKARNAGIPVNWLRRFPSLLPDKAVRLLNANWISVDTVTIRANLRRSSRPPVVVPDMEEFAGKKAHVTRVSPEGICTTYHLDVDGGEWNWANWMFEKPVPRNLKWRIAK